ncbi:delta-60 repeat domain-containing protein [Pseudomonas sp. RT6P73]
MNQVRSTNSEEFQDPTFGINGVVPLPYEGVDGRYPLGLISLPDKKTVVLFGFFSFEDNSVKVARLNEDGAPDLSFGENGTVEVSFPPEEFFAGHLFPWEGHGWLIVGTLAKMHRNSVYLTVVRQLPDGTPDNSFGPEKDGKVIIDLDELIDPYAQPGAKFLSRRHDAKSAESSSINVGDVGLVAVGQQDGKVLLGGNIVFGFDNIRGVVLRLNRDGSLDTTFNGKGFLLVEHPNISHRWNYALGVAVQQDGKILVCGDYSRKTPDELPDAYVIRYDASGSVDESYGDNKNGVVTIEDSSRWLALGRMALKADGGVVAVGSAEKNYEQEGMIVSLNPGGSFNLVFNYGRPLYSDFTPYGVHWIRCVPQADGKLIVSGNGGGPIGDETRSVVTACYNADGTLAINFWDKGWVDFNKAGIDGFRECVVMVDNRVVICTAVSGAPPATGYVVRYLPQVVS